MRACMRVFVHGSTDSVHACLQPKGCLCLKLAHGSFKLCLVIILQDPNGTYYAMMSRVMTTTPASKS